MEKKKEEKSPNGTIDRKLLRSRVLSAQRSIFSRQMLDVAGARQKSFQTRPVLTQISAVGMRLVAVVPAVIVPIAGPMDRNAAPAVAFELVAGAGMAAASFITVVPTVVVWKQEMGEKGSLLGSGEQTQPFHAFLFPHPPNSPSELMQTSFSR